MILTPLLLDLKKEFPKFSLINKSDSRLMKVIDVLLRIITFNQQKTFLTKYTTTLNTTVYLGVTGIKCQVLVKQYFYGMKECI